jgi:hypothetical protein
MIECVPVAKLLNIFDGKSQKNQSIDFHTGCGNVLSADWNVL